ncbi:hypothetical protein KUTeg_012082 [Tegillarca granosa]|uniref:Uncharacterized protein n=1 Tax=Tegillarca granosa TaxID=220873 RepID=A0ABQ9F1R5_TEGGR|nr:hypothetical protein KUTeg_012082 [Tegillarca granosa]
MYWNNILKLTSHDRFIQENFGCLNSLLVYSKVFDTTFSSLLFLKFFGVMDKMHDLLEKLKTALKCLCIHVYINSYLCITSNTTILYFHQIQIFKFTFKYNFSHLY